MKSLVTAIAALLILLVMMMQFVSNQVLHDKLTKVDRAVFAFQEELKEEGVITFDIEDRLKKDISEALGCDENLVVINGDRVEKYRGERIDYEVTMPLEGLVSSFWGVETGGDYKIEGSTMSEKIDRRSNW